MKPDATTRAVARAQKGKRKEGDLVKAVIQWINSHGGFAWRNQSGRTIVRDRRGKERAIQMGRAGLPDVVGVWPYAPLWPNEIGNVGRLIAVETKPPGQQPTAIQAATHAELRKRGAIVIVATDISDVEKALGS